MSNLLQDKPNACDAGVDDAAFAAICAVRPQWAGIGRVRDVVGKDRRILLHAGPPFPSISAIPAAVFNSLCVGCVYEGWAEDPAASRRLIESGDVELGAAQDYGILVPLAGVVSPSMALIVLQDAARPERRKYSVLNEGMALCTRLGIWRDDLPAHLRWLNTDVAAWIEARLPEPVDLYPLVLEALRAGDDCHARTVAASAAFLRLLKSRGDGMTEDGRVEEFVAASPAFALNIWMAMAGLLTSACEGFAHSSLITRAGGNGYEFGIQVAGRPGIWITAPAPEIVGKPEPRFAGRTATPALGDSAVVDLIGLGGQALDTAAELRGAMADILPHDVTQRAPDILHGPMPALGRLAVTSARKIARAGKGPIVLLGMIDHAGEEGRIGGGFVDVSAEIFARAIVGLA